MHNGNVLPLFLKSVSYTALANSIILVICGVSTFNSLAICSIGTNPLGTSSSIYLLFKDGGASISLYAQLFFMHSYKYHLVISYVLLSQSATVSIEYPILFATANLSPSIFSRYFATVFDIPS